MENINGVMTLSLYPNSNTPNATLSHKYKFQKQLIFWTAALHHFSLAKSSQNSANEFDVHVSEACMHLIAKLDISSHIVNIGWYKIQLL